MDGKVVDPLVAPMVLWVDCFDVFIMGTGLDWLGEILGGCGIGLACGRYLEGVCRLQAQVTGWERSS